MAMRMEHANLCVRDVDAMVRFLQTAFPEFRVRGLGKNKKGEEWMHFGNDETYIALSPATTELDRPLRPKAGSPGVSQLAYEVDDVDALHERLTAEGYRESAVSDGHPQRRRVYFSDPEGNDWEFIQYFSEDPAERNGCYLPDA